MLLKEIIGEFYLLSNTRRRNLSFSSVLSDPDPEKINDPKKLTLQALTVSHAQIVTPLCAKQDRRKV